MMPSPPLSLYIHIPWCIKKCPYCDFNSHEVKTEIPEFAYVDALLADLDADRVNFPATRTLQSIFIGGGTPSLFAPESFARLLDGIKRRMAFADDIEITLEANPGTFESHKFREFYCLGINRLSIGIQSFNDKLLSNLGRVHNGQEAIRAAEIAHRSGFANFNLDLMFGLPGADPSDSAADVLTAIGLKPSHISFYQLTLEPNTLFHKYPPRLPGDEVIFVTQDECQNLLEKHGYSQYEVSAYSQLGRQCRHNRNYWQFGDYLGIGAGAHGKITLSAPDKIIRYSKIKNPQHYLKNPTEYATNQIIPLSDLPLEFAMNNLRLRQGFTLAGFTSATGLDQSHLEVALNTCLERKLLHVENGFYACTDKGWLFLDSVLSHFMA